MKGGKVCGSENAFLAVAEHFPNREKTIRHLLKDDDVFLAMCEELSELKTALNNQSKVKGQHKQKHRDELLERFGCLFGKILASLLHHQRASGKIDEQNGRPHKPSISPPAEN